ncbi:MAG TPA: hypothetical protein VM093_00975 [Aeromicrobium sp.]|nr:hypothetical protein [Aeromicrobium sp.]
MSLAMGHTPRPRVYGESDPQFQVFRRTGLYLAAMIVATIAAAAVAVAALVRGVAPLWVVVVLLLLLGLLALRGVRDGQTPIFVADEYGVRLHERDTWIGLLWREIDEVVVEPTSGFRDARIKLTSKDARRTYATPVGFTTSVTVAEAEVELARRRAAASY